MSKQNQTPVPVPAPDPHVKSLVWDDVVRSGITGASGTVYRIESELSVARYAKLTAFLIEVQTGRGANELVKSVEAALNHLRKPDLVEAIRKLDGALHAAKNVSTYPHPVQKAVALFMNAEGETLEQRLAYDETGMNKKIEDWREYGLESFFPLLTALVTGSKRSLSANSVGEKDNSQTSPKPSQK